jgi:hypothetical protein
MIKSVSFVLVWMIYLVYTSLYYPVVGAFVVKNVQGTMPAFVCFAYSEVPALHPPGMSRSYHILALHVHIPDRLHLYALLLLPTNIQSCETDIKDATGQLTCTWQCDKQRIHNLIVQRHS